MSTLLPFHKKILEGIHDPGSNDLLLMARGLGLRRIICTLLKIYDSPKNLVLILNANSEEESEIGEELGIMGCRKPGLRVVAYDTGNKDRQALYKGGGLISVTSRILVVDMLKGDIPIDMITGMLVLHAEKVTALALEAFIVRLYREKNKKGFLKAFTDQPEHITSGMSPLKNIMKELQLRIVHVYPRFHEDIKKSLERRKADVIELSQDMSENMSDIHHAIIDCMNGTLYELKRSNTSLELDDLNVENAYFRSFEITVRKQLDPVWNKVGPKTKQLVNDLGTLRLLLYFLLTYDALQFHAYLETLVTSNNTSQYGGPKQHHPPWMMTDAADMIFRLAKRRCYILTTPKAVEPSLQIDLHDDSDDAWDALDDIQGRGTSIKKLPNNQTAEAQRPKWLPAGLDPVLEELPKWSLLADVLQEIEGEILRQELERAVGGGGILPPAFGSDTVLVMASSTRACNSITEFLSTMDYTKPKGSQGYSMMLRKLKLYFWWKGQLSQQASNQNANARQPAQNRPSGSAQQPQNVSDALKKDMPRRGPTRRRVRGGAPAPAESDKGTAQAKKQRNDTGDMMVDEIRDEADTFADFWAAQVNSAGGSNLASNAASNATNLDDVIEFVPDLEEFDTNYGLLEPQQTVLVRAYSNDLDDRMLAEIQPRFIVMFEPSMEFVRRVEVYRSSNPGLGVRVYHMIYTNSCEEHKYLAAIRREKYAFEKLIKERATMLLPIFEDRRAGSSEAINTISTRLAGGRREATQPSQVVVDMREFRSTLPSLLHASNLLIIPATLTVGDYILTPDICVERKSLADLVSSFNSGRLYTQCEMMSVHYKDPVLLIEFEEDKAFSLDIVSDLKSYAKPTGKYPAKKRSTNPAVDDYIPSIQSKLVLLLLSFPRVKIIWSSSPYATAEIFNDLKLNQTEPDPSKAISIGAEEDPDAGAGINSAAEELLRCLPGINTKNVKYVMSKVGSVRELCEMSLEKVQEILGVEPGKQCWEFMHKGEDGRRR